MIFNDLIFSDLIKYPPPTWELLVIPSELMINAGFDDNILKKIKSPPSPKKAIPKYPQKAAASADMRLLLNSLLIILYPMNTNTNEARKSPICFNLCFDIFISVWFINDV